MFPEKEAFSLAVDNLDHVEVQSFGNGRRVFVIDNFYRDPDRIRAIALGLGDETWVPRRAFPGLEASVPADTSELFARISRILALGDLTGESVGRVVFSALTKLGADLPPPTTQRPHFDGHSEIAGLVYLNEPTDCRGGTAFYRHKRSGLEAWPDDPDVVEVASALNLHSQGAPLFVSKFALLQHIFDLSEPLGTGLITDSNSAWELTNLVEMRYNRAVFYSTHLFHSAYVRSGDFGVRPTERRLTQTLFLRRSESTVNRS